MNPTSIYYALGGVFDYFGGANSSPLGFITLCSGAPPGIAGALPDSQILSGTAAAGSGVNFPVNSWSIPSRGVCILINGVQIPIRTSLPINKVPSFVRIGTYSMPGMEVPIDTVKGPENFVISSLNPVVSGGSVVLKDARLKIQTEGPFSLNNALANAILANWTGSMSTLLGYGGNLMFGWPTAWLPNGSAASSPLVFEAFDGPVPLSANDDATGTKLWSRSLSNLAASAGVLSVVTNTISLSTTPTANAIADGTPTYVRISKAALSGTDAGGAEYNYPKMVIQAPVGEGAGYVTFDRTTFVAGQSAALNSFTMVFYPNLT